MAAFGVRLKAARISAGFETTDDIAADLQIEPPRYRKYERGQSVPPLHILIRISDLVRKSLDWLLAGRRTERD